MQRRKPPTRQLKGPRGRQFADTEEPTMETQRVEDFGNERRAGRTPGTIIRTL